MSSFWKFVLDNEFMQRADIEAVSARSRSLARRHARQSARMEDRVEELEVEVGEMRLFTRALLALLQENGTLDPARVRDKILEIDASDGVVDGQLAAGERPETKDEPKAPVSRKRRR